MVFVVEMAIDFASSIACQPPSLEWQYREAVMILAHVRGVVGRKI
jgi:hypothetical protein